MGNVTKCPSNYVNAWVQRAPTFKKQGLISRPISSRLFYYSGPVNKTGPPRAQKHLGLVSWPCTDTQ